MIVAVGTPNDIKQALTCHLGVIGDACDRLAHGAAHSLRQDESVCWMPWDETAEPLVLMPETSKGKSDV